jgi:hypothetical protein
MLDHRNLLWPILMPILGNPSRRSASIAIAQLATVPICTEARLNQTSKKSLKFISLSALAEFSRRAVGAMYLQ